MASASSTLPAQATSCRTCATAPPGMSPTRRARSSRRSPFQAASKTSAATASTSRTSASNGSAVGDRSGDKPHRAAQSGCGASLPAPSPFGMRKLIAPGSNDLGLFPGPRGPGETSLRNCTPSYPAKSGSGTPLRPGRTANTLPDSGQRPSCAQRHVRDRRPRRLQLVREDLRARGEPVRRPFSDRPAQMPARRYLGHQRHLGPHPSLPVGRRARSAILLVPLEDRLPEITLDGQRREPRFPSRLARQERPRSMR
jgi:hypothetical protein